MFVKNPIEYTIKQKNNAAPVDLFSYNSLGKLESTIVIKAIGKTDIVYVVSKITTVFTNSMSGLIPVVL